LKVEKEKEINNSDPMIKEILEGKVLYSKGVPILKKPGKQRKKRKKKNVIFKISERLIQEHQGHKRILSPKRRFDITKNVEVEYKGEMRKFRGELRPLNATELNINSVNKNEIIKEKNYKR